MATRTRKPKLGPPIDPNSPPPTAVVVVPESNGLDVEWGTKTVTAGVAFDFDPAIMVAGMRDAWLSHVRTCLLEGTRPDGGGETKPLGARAALEPNRISEFRNVASGTLADGLRSLPLESNGQTASVRCLPPQSRQAHCVKERARGVDIMTTRGAAGAAAIAGAKAAVEAMMTGREVIHDDGEVTSKEADQ